MVNHLHLDIIGGDVVVELHDMVPMLAGWELHYFMGATICVEYLGGVTFTFVVCLTYNQRTPFTLILKSDSCVNRVHL